NSNTGRLSGGYYFRGVIDEIRVYNRPLSQTEIQTDMITPIRAATGPPPPSAIPGTKTPPGTFTQGQTATYTVTVTNSGSGPTTSAVTVTDTLPAGLTATAVA